MQQQQAVLFTPVRDKVVGGINATAKEKNLIYVFDVSAGNPVYVSDESVNLKEALFEAMINISVSSPERLPINPINYSEFELHLLR